MMIPCIICGKDAKWAILSFEFNWQGAYCNEHYVEKSASLRKALRAKK